MPSRQLQFNPAKKVSDFDLKAFTGAGGITGFDEVLSVYFASQVHHPRSLLLDEPSIGLDIVVRRKFMETLRALAAQGRTLLW